MFCTNCGQTLEEGTTVCPACGAVYSAPVIEQPSPIQMGQTPPVVQQVLPVVQPVQPIYQTNVYTPPEQPKYNGLCVAGFVCSFFFPIVGLILSIVGVSQCKKGVFLGKGLGVAGIVLSIIFSILSIIVAILGAALGGIAAILPLFFL